MILAAPKLAHARGQPHVGILWQKLTIVLLRGVPDLLMGFSSFSNPLYDSWLSPTIEFGRNLMKSMLVYPRSMTDLLYLPDLVLLGYKSDNLRNPGMILVRFNGTQTHSLKNTKTTKEMKAKENGKKHKK